MRRGHHPCAGCRLSLGAGSPASGLHSQRGASMSHRRSSRLSVLLALLLSSTLLIATAAAAHEPDAAATSVAAGPTHKASESPLADAYRYTLKGARTADGLGCRFQLPALELPPGKTAIASRQVSVDHATCTSQVEVGTPTEPLGKEPSDGRRSTGSARSTQARGAGSAPMSVLASETAYFRVWWEDVVGLKVTEVRSNIAWSYNGSCVTSASGSYYNYWRTGTGWRRDSYGSWVSRTCSVAKVWSDATYHNSIFCAGGTVRNYYDNVEVRGWNTGGLGGSVYRTWTTYPYICIALHWHQELRRT
jgi:hypothetical protein